jgi:hypothetical protein
MQDLQDDNAEAEQALPEYRYWGIPAGIAWICFRDKGLCHRIERHRWNMRELNTELALESNCSRRQPLFTVRDARRMFNLKFQAGDLPAWGTATDRIETSEIPEVDRRSLEIGTTRNKDGLVPIAGASLSDRYVSVAMRSAAVMKVWPATKGNGRPPNSHTTRYAN